MKDSERLDELEKRYAELERLREAKEREVARLQLQLKMCIKALDKACRGD